MKKYVKTMLITVLLILVNMGGKYLTGHFDLPFWADSFGTIAGGFIFGPISGAVIGASSNIILAMSGGYQTLFYCLVSIGIGISAGIFGRRGIFDHFFSSVTYAFGLTIFTSLLSSVLDLIVWGGGTGNVWGDASVHYFMDLGWHRIPACFAAQFILEFTDKILAVALFYGLLRLFRFSRKKVKLMRLRKGTAALLLVASLLPIGLLPLVTPLSARAEGEDGSYVQTLYNEKTGLTPGHATSAAATRDGLLWIGTYAGLYTYDGFNFRHFEGKKIKSVNCLYVDREGRLWVGTNDRGLAIIINGSVSTVLNAENGLASDSVRSIVQASDGTIYVGTAGRTQTVSLSNGITVTGDIGQATFSDDSVGGPDGLVSMAGDDGKLFLLKAGKILDQAGSPDSITTSVFKGDTLYAGTGGGNIIAFDTQNEKLIEAGRIDTGIGSAINELDLSDGGGFLAVSDKGLFRVGKGGETGKVNTGDFTYSLQSTIRDYQGNLWVTSTRQGLLEISPSAYSDLFASFGMEKRLTNAVLKAGDLLYAGCDDGLFIIDEKTGQKVTNPLSEALSGVRVRALAEDGDGTIYAASYGKGLLALTRDGQVRTYAGETGPGDWVRTLLRAGDGTVLSSGDNGISFIRGGEIVHHIPYGGDLGNVSVLCLTETGDGKLIATTDGNGLFIIEDGIVTDHLTKEDGLSSDVVLKATGVPDTGIVLLVTSNSLMVYAGGRLRELTDFPYSNNYDILVDEDKACFVTGSAGIYMTTLDDLLTNDGRDAELSTTIDGLPSALTVNSGNLVGDGFLYLCGSTGVIRVDTKKLTGEIRSLRIRARSIRAGGRSYGMGSGSDILIPGSAGKITICPEVINFSKNDPKISYRLSGYEKDWHTVKASDLEDLTYSGLGAGNYRFDLAVRKRDGSILEINSTPFAVSEELYEQPVFKVYLLIVTIALIGWVTWFFTHLFLKARAEKTEAALELATKQVEMGNESVLAMAKALFSKDRRTGEHCHRVAWYASELAKAYGFSDKETKNLKKAALLHDIGKIAIPDAVLNKPAKLTDEEYAIMKTHTTAGADILKGFTIVDHVSEGARYHHERYDGKGYPEGIFGENIPLYGRIIAVADTFDAMTANRVYRGALDMDHVISEIKNGRGTQLDPYLADLFLDLIARGTVDPQKTFEMFRGRDLTEDIK